MRANLIGSDEADMDTKTTVLTARRERWSDPWSERGWIYGGLDVSIRGHCGIGGSSFFFSRASSTSNFISQFDTPRCEEAEPSSSQNCQRSFEGSGHEASSRGVLVLQGSEPSRDCQGPPGRPHKGKYKKTMTGLGILQSQKNKLALLIETMKMEEEAATALKLTSTVEAVRAVAKEEIEREIMDEVNKLGGEFMDHGYHLFRRKIQKLYPDLDISRVNDVELEDSEPTSLEPTLILLAVDAEPIFVTPPVTIK
ncbi:hypothetical protein F0562_030573 [Nyssa sinensis]|uniref:Uncharacterized protein n=1 Tax=Nyssa sinensis TaxID=561372 RepID=A0A5J5AZ52_9ASTE|nr:hypothetical protein F0562_030573 [Nyssa sinensis]